MTGRESPPERTDEDAAFAWGGGLRGPSGSDPPPTGSDVCGAAASCCARRRGFEWAGSAPSSAVLGAGEVTAFLSLRRPRATRQQTSTAHVSSKISATAIPAIAPAARLPPLGEFPAVVAPVPEAAGVLAVRKGEPALPRANREAFDPTRAAAALRKGPYTTPLMLALAVPGRTPLIDATTPDTAAMELRFPPAAAMTVSGTTTLILRSTTT